MIYTIKKQLNSNLYLKNIIIQGGGNFFAQFFGFASLPIITRLYDPTGFGYLSQFTTLISFLTILITFRYEYFVLVPKKVETSLAFFKEITKLGLFMTLLLTIIIIIIICFKIENSSSIYSSNIIIIGPLTAFFASISIAAQQINQKAELYITSALSELINKILFFVSAVILFLFDCYYGLIFATISGYLFKTIFLVTKKNIFATFKRLDYFLYSFDNLVKFKKPALSFSFSNIIQTVNGFLPIIFITEIYGTYILGQWSLAISAVYLPTSIIGSAIGQVYYQSANKLFVEGVTIEKIWFQTVKSLIYIALPSFLFIALAAPFLFPIFFGYKWHLAGIYTSILSISVGMSFISTPVDRTCFIVKREDYPYLINLLRLFFSILSIIFTLVCKFSFLQYLFLNSMLSSILYLYDIYRSYLFSKLILTK